MDERLRIGSSKTASRDGCLTDLRPAFDNLSFLSIAASTTLGSAGSSKSLPGSRAVHMPSAHTSGGRAVTVAAQASSLHHAPHSWNLLQHLHCGVALGHARGFPHTAVGGDKGFDTADFVRECRNLHMTPHVAQNMGRRGGSAIDSRTTRHTGYAISQKKRKRIEECFGWLKTIALLRKVRHRGTLKVDWIFTFACAAYNLVRMRNLMAATVPAQ